MTEKQISELTDQELLEKAKSLKSLSITVNAVLIGFCLGVIIYSIVENSIGLFTLIPLVFIFKIVDKSKKIKTIENLLQERNSK